jgi:hypothetical protein
MRRRLKRVRRLMPLLIQYMGRSDHRSWYCLLASATGSAVSPGAPRGPQNQNPFPCGEGVTSSCPRQRPERQGTQPPGFPTRSSFGTAHRQRPRASATLSKPLIRECLVYPFSSISRCRRAVACVSRGSLTYRGPGCHCECGLPRDPALLVFFTPGGVTCQPK